MRRNVVVKVCLSCLRRVSATDISSLRPSLMSRCRRDDPNTGRFQKSVKVVEWLVEGAMAELDLR